MLIDTSIVWGCRYDNDNRLKKTIKDILTKSVIDQIIKIDNLNKIKIITCDLLAESRITSANQNSTYNRITFTQIEQSLPPGYTLKKTRYGGFIFNILKV